MDNEEPIIKENKYESVLLMAPNVKSIKKVAISLLSRSREENISRYDAREKAQLKEDKNYFFVELTRIILNWMGAGWIDDIQGLLSGIRAAIHENSDEPYFLTDVSLHQNITGRLQLLNHFISVFLETVNVQKYLGQLSGKRRMAWRLFIVEFYRKQQQAPMTIGEFVGSLNDNHKPNSVRFALDNMSKMGLFSKIQGPDDNKVTYQLTWDGSFVARFLENECNDVVANTQEDTKDLKRELPKLLETLSSKPIDTSKKLQTSFEFIILIMTALASEKGREKLIELFYNHAPNKAHPLSLSPEKDCAKPLPDTSSRDAYRDASFLVSLSGEAGLSEQLKNYSDKLAPITWGDSENLQYPDNEAKNLSSRSPSSSSVH